MFPYNYDHLQLLLETEGGDLGNLSQHLAVMGISWWIHIGQDLGQADPAERLTHATAELRVDAGCWMGHGTLHSDCSGEWTFEEALLSVLESALRDLWTGQHPYTPWNWNPDEDDIPF